MSGKRHLPFLLTYLMYSVEASNPLTSFADFCFKDGCSGKIIGAIHILGLPFLM